MAKIHPVILSGGSGSRLWPWSRKACPKQFLKLVGDETLFQQTLKRLSSPLFGAPSVICNNDHRFLAAGQLQEAGMEPEAIVLEPVARNTAPAALTAALLAAREDPKRLVLLLPSDHVIQDEEGFARSIAAGIAAAEAGRIVTFGIAPDRPETGYGYIETRGDGAVLDVTRFVEKPDRETAEGYLRAGGYFWNAGIFLFSARAMLSAFGKYAPEIFPPCREAVEKAETDLDFLRLDKQAYAACPSISLDYAIMEKAENTGCVPLDSQWSDLGAWPAVWEIMDKDEQGNVARGDVLLHETTNSYAHSMDGTVLSVAGLEGVLAVATRDAVLVASRDHAQDVGKLVEELKARGRRQATEHARVYRPWGWYEGLAEGERYQVKTLMVKPGARLSLQSHHHRAEHWVVVRGTVRVTNGDESFLLSENESTYIPIGNRHRLENPGKLPALLIEVQSGAYLGEDDIVRFSDDYGREGETQ